MSNIKPDKRKTLGPRFVGILIGGAVGAILGNMLCVGYDLLYGPWFPQAGVDPQPAGWVGWWMAGGAVVGALAGLIMAVMVVGLWGPRRKQVHN